MMCYLSHQTAVVNTEEGGDDVKSAWSSDALGDTRATMAGTMSDANPRGGANLFNPSLSSDWRLQLASMKLESLVTVNQHVTVNTFSGFVLTARQLRRADKTRSSRSRESR